MLTIIIRQPLEEFDSLSTYGFNSSVSEYEDESPTSVVRIPDSYIPNPIPSDALKMNLLGEVKSRVKKKPVETTNATTNIRATPILPPRAVLSSPDNDGLIRNKAKGKLELVSALKDHSSCENRHVRCKATPTPRNFGTTKIPRKEPKERLETKSTLNEKTRADVAESKQKAHERKQKPEWVF